MFSIGEFSKISGLSLKTLRFYHERGLLIPARVEAGTGYRYYDDRNLETARTIIALRDIGASIEEIHELLKGVVEEADVLEFLERRKLELQERMAADRKVIQTIERIIHQEGIARTLIQEASSDIVVQELPVVLVAGIRMKGAYEECGKVYAKLGRTLGRHIKGPPLCLYYDFEYRETDADFEPCMPVRKSIAVDGVHVRELAGGKAITAMHLGPYSELGRSYEKLIRYAKTNGHSLTTPSREVFLKGPGMIFKGNPKNYVTEIQILVT